MISLKSGREVAHMRRAGRIIAKVFDRLGDAIEPGVTTKELDEVALEVIKKAGGSAAFKGYKGFPGNICTSVNNIVVHGIPGRAAVKDGDIISIDVGVGCDGYYADAAYTFEVGSISKRARRLLDITRESLRAGIDEAVAERRLSNISHAIQKSVESHGYSVVRALVGHGIGSEIHEDPEIPNYGPPNKGILLKPGMTLAIEPMVNEGSFDVELCEDGWSVITKDGSLSCHFEHTVLITKDKPEILTQ